MADNPIVAAGPAIVEALRKGNKIEAIKLLRQASGLGLAEAKGMVERYEMAKETPKGVPTAKGHEVTGGSAGSVGAKYEPSSVKAYRPRPGLSPGQVDPSSGGGAAAVVIAVLGAVGAAIYFLVR